MTKKIFLSLFVIIFSSFKLFSQEKIYFPYFEVINVNPKYQYSTAKLFKSYVENNNKYLLIIPTVSTDSVAYNENFETTQNKAKACNADFFLIGEMNALNETLIISVTLYNTIDGKRVWNDLLKARSTDDLDPILLLLSKAIGTKKKASEMEDIFSVTDYNSKSLNKKDAQTLVAFAIGGLLTPYKNVENIFSSGMQGKVVYDNKNVVLDMSAEFYFGKIKYYGVSLAALHPFSNKNNAPFLGGGIGLSGHYITTNSSIAYHKSYDANGGLTLFTSGGYLFNRTSNIQMRLGGSLYCSLYEVFNKLPYGASLNFAVLFGK